MHFQLSPPKSDHPQSWPNNLYHLHEINMLLCPLAETRQMPTAASEGNVGQNGIVPAVLKTSAGARHAADLCDEPNVGISGQKNKEKLHGS